ncbi:MAG: SDR family oxidoreductase [Actinomycetes bacterium]
MSGPRALVFGSSGAIGTACVTQLQAGGFEVVSATRGLGDGDQLSTSIGPDWPNGLPGKLAAVVWAQGANASGSVLDVGETDLDDLVEANVGFIARTVRELVKADALVDHCRFVVISSIWQDLVRKDKFAYTVSKAAVAGLVRSLAVDLAERGVVVNAVLPGVLDTPMPRANLTGDQLAAVLAATPAGRLATVDDVANAVAWLVSDKCTGVTGQFLTVDGGWSVHRHV